MNRRTWRVLPVTAAVASALVLSACGSSDSGGSSKSSSSLNVSFATATEASDLFHSLHTGLDGLIKDSGSDVAVKWYDNNFDAPTMLKNANLMVQDKPDVIVNFPVTDVTKGIGQQFTDAKIPCVSLNVSTPGCAFLNIDNGVMGEQSADILAAEAVKRGWTSADTTVLIGDYAAAGESVNSSVWDFYAKIAPQLGFPNKAADSFTVKTTKIADNAYQFDSTGATDGSFTSMKNLVPSIPKGNHVILYAVNDDAAIGALRALEDAGLAADDNLLVAGQGGAKAGLDALRSDPRWLAQGVVFVDHWGEYAVAAGQALIKGGKQPGDVTPLPQAVLTKDTIEQYFPDGASSATMLPPLVEGNKWLSEGGFLQEVGNVQDLK